MSPGTENSYTHSADSETDNCRWSVPTAIRTNALYDVLLLPNIGISASVTDRIIVGADWMATWLNNSRHRYYRVYGGDIDL